MMPDSSRLKRMISLRLSESEYEVLKAQYHRYGASSVSDLARLAIQQLTQGSGLASDVASKLHEISTRLDALEGRLSVIDRSHELNPRVLQIQNH